MNSLIWDYENISALGNRPGPNMKDGVHYQIKPTPDPMTP